MLYCMEGNFGGRKFGEFVSKLILVEENLVNLSISVFDKVLWRTKWCRKVLFGPVV